MEVISVLVNVAGTALGKLIRRLASNNFHTFASIRFAILGNLHDVAQNIEALGPNFYLI